MLYRFTQLVIAIITLLSGWLLIPTSLDYSVAHAETIHDLGFGPSGGARIDTMIKRLRPTSPLFGHGNEIVAFAMEFNIDPLMIIVMVNESQLCTDNGVVSPSNNPSKPNYNCGGITWPAAQTIGEKALARWHAERGPYTLGHYFTYLPSPTDGLGLFFNYVGTYSDYKGKSMAGYYEIYNPCADPENRGRFSCGAVEAENMLELLRQNAGQASTEPGAYIPTTSTSSTYTSSLNTSCAVTKVGDPQSPAPTCAVNQTGNSTSGDGGGVIRWADKITQNLQNGGALWSSLYNKQEAEICNDAGVCAHKQTGNSQEDLYWCTYLVVDSFTLAGKKGLNVGAHGAVVGLAAFWKKTPGYTFLPYNSDNLTDPANKQTLTSLRPGMPYFLYKVADQTLQEEHTAIIKEIQIDQNGNGKYVTLESNSSAITHAFPIDNWVVKNHHRILRGFGAFEGSEGSPSNTETIQAALVSLPGNSGGIVMYADGKTVEKNSDKQLPSFSVIKLWIAAAAYNAKINLSEQVRVEKSDVVEGTGVLREQAPITVSYDELVRLMLVYSDNTATNLLIKKIGGFGPINTYISQNGYSKTKLQRFMSQPNYTAANDNYSSARDAALFMKRLYDKQVVSPQVSNAILNILDDRSKNEQKGYIYLGKELPSTALLREKSGVGGGVRNDAGTFVTVDGKRVYVAVFLSTLSNESAGEAAIANLAKTIYTNK